MSGPQQPFAQENGTWILCSASTFQAQAQEEIALQEVKSTRFRRNHLIHCYQNASSQVTRKPELMKDGSRRSFCWKDGVAGLGYEADSRSDPYSDNGVAGKTGAK
jgi:hypothetical protein